MRPRDGRSTSGGNAKSSPVGARHWTSHCDDLFSISGAQHERAGSKMGEREGGREGAAVDRELINDIRRGKRERLDPSIELCAHLTSFYNCRLRRCHRQERNGRTDDDISAFNFATGAAVERNSHSARDPSSRTNRISGNVSSFRLEVSSRHSVSRHELHSPECLPREYCVSLRAFYFSLQSHLEGVRGGGGGGGRTRPGRSGAIKALI